MAFFDFLNRKRVKLLHGKILKGGKGRYVGYFEEFPELVVQGANQNEIKERLVKGLVHILEIKKQESQDEIQNNTYSGMSVERFELSAAL